MKNIVYVFMLILLSFCVFSDVYFTAPTDSGYINRSYFYVNVTSNQTGFSNMTLNVYNSTELIYSNLSTNNISFFNTVKNQIINKSESVINYNNIYFTAKYSVSPVGSGGYEIFHVISSGEIYPDCAGNITTFRVRSYIYGLHAYTNLECLNISNSNYLILNQFDDGVALPFDFSRYYEFKPYNSSTLLNISSSTCSETTDKNDSTYIEFSEFSGSCSFTVNNVKSNVTDIYYYNLSDGIYFYNVTSYNSTGNIQNSITQNVTIDTSAPNQSIENEQSENNFILNITPTDLNYDYTTINLYNSSQDLIDSVNSTYYDFSGLNNGLYFYDVYTYDKAGNSAYSGLGNFTINYSYAAHEKSDEIITVCITIMVLLGFICVVLPKYMLYAGIGIFICLISILLHYLL
jgi:hypothetical protein